MEWSGLDLHEEHSQTIESSLARHGAGPFIEALDQCSSEDKSLASEMLGKYFITTSPIRASDTRDEWKEGIVGFFSVAAAPVASLLIPVLGADHENNQRSIVLAQMSYKDRFGMSIDMARGYMVERLITQGNVWEREWGDYVWLGQNYRRVATVAASLALRPALDVSLVKEMLEGVPSLSSGSL